MVVAGSGRYSTVRVSAVIELQKLCILELLPYLYSIINLSYLGMFFIPLLLCSFQPPFLPPFLPCLRGLC
ncbi:hypothetical protein L873DRAFT_562256 [Choiromyces venosus 120613-1]|uniref:Uncharacterized protein n=1 Tax=Choiromyces venosus 120613-1 TaxID=1336337 RepID=A0A3N4JYI7_9PEZI|nr:hypothetical protein L873DRAFT_562256 [Choiromyces venosus 120613-1]